MVKTFTQFTNFLWAGLAVVLFQVTSAQAQVSIHPYLSSYSQNFDGLPSSGTGTWEHGTQFFPGWHLFRTAPSTTTITAGTGSHNAGGLYSFGLAGSSDRALGSIASATAGVGEFAWGLLIQNNTGHTITNLHISYTGEQWRSSRLATPQHMLSFWYATSIDPAAFNLSPKSDAGWTNVPDLNFMGPVFYAAAGALDGNAPANKRYLTASIPVTVPDKGYVMLRWKDLDEFENDHGLAIDDFSMTWSTNAPKGPVILPVELVQFTARQHDQDVQLNWTTASEKDNSHFIVERSPDGRIFNEIGTIAGNGTSATRSSYSFTDQQPFAGVVYYRLKQVDVDGTYSHSKSIALQLKALSKTILYPTTTSGTLSVQFASEGSEITILDATGRRVHHEQLPFRAMKHNVHIGQLKAGNYFLQVHHINGTKQVLRFVKQ